MRTLCLCMGLMALQACGAPSGTMPEVEVSADAGFDAGINAFRAGQDLGELRLNAALTAAASAHAADMQRRGYFAHQSPGGPNGASFVDRARAAGCNLRSGAENIAQGQPTQARVLQAWIASDGHRENMIVPGYTQYGLGRAENTWVLMLAASC